MERASSFFGYTFCGAAICPTLSPLSFPLLGHFFYQCPSSLYLKHYIAFFSFFSLFYFLISTPHFIILLNSISNLFWEADVFFSPTPLFLQLQARCLNFLHSKHIFPFLSSNSALNLVRVCFSLSIMPIRLLYCYGDIVLCLGGMEIMLSLAIYFYICWDTRSSSN